MRPDRETNEAYLYCLAVSAERHQIQVLFTLAMSNHHHTGIHDPCGNYPAFLEYFHKLFAKCQNALRGRWENFWATEQTSVVRLDSPRDVLDKLVYSLTNPVKDHLVENALDWPGVSSLRAMLEGKVMTAKRPSQFFRQDGGMPAEATLCLVRPHGFGHLTREQWAKLLLSRIQEVESSAWTARRKTKLEVLGARGVLRQSWHAFPSTREPRRDLRPRLAAKNQWRRFELLLQNKAFLAAYRAARLAFQEGLRRVIFPLGTYWLKRFAAAICEDAPLLAVA